MGISAILEKARKLKETPRAGWVRSEVPSPESVSEHSYDVALIVSIIADQLNLGTPKSGQPLLDHSKLVRAALVHDLGESETGDIPFKTDKQAAEERAALSEILGTLPEVKEKYLEDLTEQEKAVLSFADNLSMLKQAEAYGVDEIAETANKNLKNITSSFPELKKFL